MVYNEKALKKSTLFLTSDCNMFNSGSIEFIKRGKFVKNDFFSKTLGGLERPGFVHVYYHLMGGTDQYDKMVHGYSICKPYKGNRWILRIICMFKDFEFLNTYIIHKKHNPKPISRSHFFINLRMNS